MDNFVNILRKHKLRPTKQRVNLGSILFGKGDRHITAEILKKESDKEYIDYKIENLTLFLKEIRLLENQ